MTTITMPDTDGEFEAWLAAKPPGAIVGYPSDTSFCPIAIFLTERGCKNVRVLSNRYGSRDAAYGDRQPNPPWAMKVIATTDKLTRHWINAGELIAVLAGKARRGKNRKASP